MTDPDTEQQLLAIRLNGVSEAIAHILQGHPGRAEYALVRAELRATHLQQKAATS